MTTVAYRDGVIAADTGVSIGAIRIGTYHKIVRHRDGGLAGICGGAPFAAKFLKWVRTNEEIDIDDLPSFHDNGNGNGNGDEMERGILILPANPQLVWVYEPKGWFDLACPYYAMGAGREISMGVMWKDGSAIEAVRACIAHDSDTFGLVESLTFDRDDNDE